MTNIGQETKAKACRKCQWCAQYTHFDVWANTQTSVYYCQFPGGNWKRGRKEEPTLDRFCPYFSDRQHYEPEDD